MPPRPRTSRRQCDLLRHSTQAVLVFVETALATSVSRRLVADLCSKMGLLIWLGMESGGRWARSRPTASSALTDVSHTLKLKVV
mmetsp:Transcript_151588/g.486414  ORF Transcript_151588/g.486414 Transcript_151588/m.486414 type:complete len:84 (-) Transcript_151588:557-808(-)